MLILFGANRLPDLARGMGESILNFNESIRNFKAGTPVVRMQGEERRQKIDSRPGWFVIIACMAAAIILSVLILDVFSGEQKLALSAVLLVWIGVGYWSFARNSRKGDDQ